MRKPTISLGVYLLSIVAIICFAAFFIAPMYIGEDRVLSPIALASWILGAGSVTGFLLIGQRVWWAWYINVVVQALWVAFWVWQGDVGPIITAIVYILVFIQNALRWSHEYHFEEKDIPARERGLRRLRPKDSDEEEVSG
jgi:hypothetical protein